MISIHCECLSCQRGLSSRTLQVSVRARARVRARVVDRDLQHMAHHMCIQICVSRLAPHGTPHVQTDLRHTQTNRRYPSDLWSGLERCQRCAQGWVSDEDGKS